jgi:signal transduction histidine kinase
MRISDDGCGFLDRAPGLEEHYGLLSMRERAQLIQATFQLDSSPGHGTRIEVNVPPLRRHLSAAAL